MCMGQYVTYLLSTISSCGFLLCVLQTSTNVGAPCNCRGNWCVIPSFSHKWNLFCLVLAMKFHIVLILYGSVGKNVSKAPIRCTLRKGSQTDCIIETGQDSYRKIWFFRVRWIRFLDSHVCYICKIHTLVIAERILLSKRI